MEHLASCTHKHIHRAQSKGKARVVQHCHVVTDWRWSFYLDRIPVRARPGNMIWQLMFSLFLSDCLCVCTLLSVCVSVRGSVWWCHSPCLHVSFSDSVCILVCNCTILSAATHVVRHFELLLSDSNRLGVCVCAEASKQHLAPCIPLEIVTWESALTEYRGSATLTWVEKPFFLATSALIFMMMCVFLRCLAWLFNCLQPNWLFLQLSDSSRISAAVNMPVIDIALG